MPKFVSDLDLNQNELQNVISQNLASAPATPKSGQSYFNTATNHFMGYNGTSWLALDGQGQVYTFTSPLSESSGTVTIGDASTSAKGVIEIATDTEASTGTDTTRAINAKQLATKVTANNAITGATHTKITYDSKGLVTSGADLQASDIPNLTLSKITDVTATASELNVLDGITATTTELNYVDGVTSAIQTQLNNKVASNTSITGATKCKITYDSKGLVTAGADLAASDIPDISATYQTKLSSTNKLSASYISGLATVATSGAYSDLTGTPTVDQTYSGTSTNAQSGVAVKSAIDSAISSVYKPAGSVAFASLPTPSSSIEGNVYNVTDAFTTTSDFVEGAGKSYPAGTNVVCINTTGTTYKWDVLTGMVDLSAYQLANTAVTHTASTGVGGTTQPVYIASDGTATATTYSLGKSVPADAVFTDTTYSVFTGATGSAAGTAGLVKAPAATDNVKYLKGDGTWSALTWTYDSSTETLTIK